MIFTHFKIAGRDGSETQLQVVKKLNNLGLVGRGLIQK